MTSTDIANQWDRGQRGKAHNVGIISSGTFRPDVNNSNMQIYINGGAHTLAPPSYGGDYTIVLQITNNASAGAVTTSSFTKVSGDSLTTTNGDDFFLFITKLNSFTHLFVQALQ